MHCSIFVFPRPRVSHHDISNSLPFLDKFIRLKATSILSLKIRIKKWLTRLCLCGSACSFCFFIR